MSIQVNNGAVVAFGSALDQTTLARIKPASVGVVALAANSANNLNLSTPGLNNISLGAVGASTFSGTITPGSNGYLLGGGGGTLNVTSAALAGSGSVTVGGAGTVSLTGVNTYSGITAVKNGATLIANVSNGSTTSGIGQSSNAAANLVLDGGTFRGVGTTDRLFSLTANGGTLDNASIGLSSTGAMGLPAGASTTLTLTGTNTGHININLAIADPAGGFVAGVNKTGSGKWTYNAANNKTYSGDTHVMAGTLEGLTSNAFSKDSNLVVDAGAGVELHGTSQQINGLSGMGSIVNSFGSTSQTLTIGANNGNGSFTGTIATALSVSKTGTGSQTLAGVDTYSGSTTVSNGTLSLGSPHTLSSVTINSPGRMQVNAGPFTITGVLTINGGGALDIADQTAILKSTTLLAAKAQIVIGYAGGAWTGNGITSTDARAIAADASAAHKTAVGYATAGALGIGTFAGSSVGGTDVLLRYTLLGDANLDGVVTTSDFAALASDFNTAGSWSGGDFNNDGVVNALDFNAIATNFGGSIPIASAPALGSLVPEPASVGALALSSALFLTRRRRLKGN